MLLNYNSSKILYVLGDGVTAQQTREYIQEETDGTVQCLSHTQFDTLQDHDQCVPGFLSFRQNLNSIVQTKNLNWVTFIHKKAFVDKNTRIGTGVVIMPTAFVDYNTTVGNFCTICPSVVVGHGAHLGNNVVLCPNTYVGGSTHIGDNFWAGPSTTVCDHRVIGVDITCVIGSTVTKDLVDPGRYYNNKRMID
jgi:UDP-3-O-[3-hydroxymyristoyl] glucosamine N-acyltransferase